MNRLRDIFDGVSFSGNGFIVELEFSLWWDEVSGTGFDSWNCMSA